MFDKWFSYSTIHDLRPEQLNRAAHLSDKELRNEISIGVIDDKPFEARQNLENLGYHIDFLSDPQTLEVVNPHHILLCDLQGVGRQLDTSMQGAFIIGEIKRNHPEKYVIAYTGGSPNNMIAREAQSRADAYLRKDATIEEWRDKLDDTIREIVHPVEVWHRLRFAMVERDVDTLEILKLEDAYVKSIKSGKSKSDSPFRKIAKSNIIKSDARAIANSLISSSLFDLIVGGA